MPIPSATFADVRPPGDPPLRSPATALGIDESIPQTVEALKGEAVKVCELLVLDFPHRPEAHSVMALTNMRVGLTAEAVETWDKCLRLAPNFSPAHLGLGTVAALKGDHENAERRLRKALALNPELAGAYAQLTEVLLQQGEVEEALDVAREHVRRFPESRESHYWLGQVCLELGQYEDAKISHAAALEIDSGLSSSYYSLAIACMRLGEQDQAIAYRQKFAARKEEELQEERGRDRLYHDVVAQREAVANVYMSAGDVCLHQADQVRAEAHWLRGAQIEPTNTACREALVRLYQRQERFGAAIQVLMELVALQPECVTYRIQVGRHHTQLGNARAAAEAFRQAIQQDSAVADAYLGLVTLQLKFGWSVPDAVALAERAVTLAPSPQSYMMLSAARQETGDPAGALDAIEKASQLDPGNLQLRELLEQQRPN